MYHYFCIHSSVDGCLGCFCVLAIVNTAGLNICGTSVFPQFGFPQGVCLEVGLLGCMVLLYGKQDEDSLKKLDILTLLILTSQEQKLSLHWFPFSSISSISVFLNISASQTDQQPWHRLKAA